MLRRYSEYRKARLRESLLQAETHTEAVDILLEWMKVELVDKIKLPVNLFESANFTFNERYNICVKKDYEHHRNIIEAYVVYAKHALLPAVLIEAEAGQAAGLDMASIEAEVDKMVDELGRQIIGAIAANRDVSGSAGGEDPSRTAAPAPASNKHVGFEGKPHMGSANDGWGDEDIESTPHAIPVRPSGGKAPAGHAPVSSSGKPRVTSTLSSPRYEPAYTGRGDDGSYRYDVDPYADDNEDRTIKNEPGYKDRGSWWDSLKALGKHAVSPVWNYLKGFGKAAQLKGTKYNPKYTAAKAAKRAELGLDHVEGEAILEEIQNIFLENADAVMAVMDEFKLKIKKYLRNVLQGVAPAAAAATVAGGPPASAATPTGKNPVPAGEAGLDATPEVGPESAAAVADPATETNPAERAADKEVDRSAAAEAPTPAGKQRALQGAQKKEAVARTTLRSLGVGIEAKKTGQDKAFYTFSDGKHTPEKGTANLTANNPLGFNKRVGSLILNVAMSHAGISSNPELVKAIQERLSVSKRSDSFQDLYRKSGIFSQIMKHLNVPLSRDEVAWNDDNVLQRDEGQPPEEGGETAPEPLVRQGDAPVIPTTTKGAAEKKVVPPTVNPPAPEAGGDVAAAEGDDELESLMTILSSADPKFAEAARKQAANPKIREGILAGIKKMGVEGAANALYKSRTGKDLPVAAAPSDKGTADLNVEPTAAPAKEPDIDIPDLVDSVKMTADEKGWKSLPSDEELTKIIQSAIEANGDEDSAYSQALAHVEKMNAAAPEGETTPEGGDETAAPKGAFEDVINAISDPEDKAVIQQFFAGDDEEMGSTPESRQERIDLVNHFLDQGMDVKEIAEKLLDTFDSGEGEEGEAPAPADEEDPEKKKLAEPTAPVTAPEPEEEEADDDPEVSGMLSGLRKTNSAQLDGWLSNQAEPRKAARALLDKHGGNVRKAMEEILASGSRAAPERVGATPIGDEMSAARANEPSADELDDEEEGGDGFDLFSQLNPKQLKQYEKVVAGVGEDLMDELRDQFDVDSEIAQRILDYGNDPVDIKAMVSALKNKALEGGSGDDEDEDLEDQWADNKYGKARRGPEDEDNDSDYYDHFKVKLDKIKNRLMNELFERRKSS